MTTGYTTYPVASTVALFLTNRFRRCEVLTSSKPKRQVNAFSIMSSLPYYSRSHARIRVSAKGWDKGTARQLKKQHLRLVFLSRGVSFLLFYSPNKLHLHVQKLKYPRIRNEISMDTWWNNRGYLNFLFVPSELFFGMIENFWTHFWEFLR